MSADGLKGTPSPVRRKTIFLRGPSGPARGRGRRGTDHYRERWIFPAEMVRQKFTPRARRASVRRAGPDLGAATFHALIINASEEAALVMTDELEREFPGCAILYAPTLALARWLLKRRSFDVVVTSPMLPDGSVAALRTTLHRLENPPDLLVVGDQELQTRELLQNSVYRLGAKRELSPGALSTKLEKLGADIRNDLNNPLQEIVAMVFVAKVADSLTDQTAHALTAIERAAKRMADVVWRLEDKLISETLSK